MSDSVPIPRLSSLSVSVGEQAVSEIANAFKEFALVWQQETTKRTEIEARRQAALAKISAMRDVLLTSLDRRFDEREQLIDGHFKLIQQGIEKGDTGLVDKSLAGLYAIVKTSPFEGLADFGRMLNDDSQELEI